MPDWITVRIPIATGAVTHRAPFNASTTSALVRAARSVRPSPGRALIEPRFSIYVVLLEYEDERQGLYVGMTGLSPEERFLNHKAGRKASRQVRRYGVGLLPALYRHLNPLDWAPAQAAEAEMATALRRTGIRVFQG